VTTGLLRVKKWSDFQHYRDRKPPWIKLHRSLLDDLEYFSLSDRSARFLPLLWLIASDSDRNGELPSIERLAWRLRIPEHEMEQVAGELFESGFLEPTDGAAIAAVQWSPRYIQKAVRMAVWARDAGRCRGCGSQVNIEFDHVVPISHGGAGGEDNVQLLCRACNRRKHNKLDSAERVATDAVAFVSPRQRREEAEGENVLPSLRSGSESAANHLKAQDVVVDASVVEAKAQSVGDRAGAPERTATDERDERTERTEPQTRIKAPAWSNEASDDWNARFGDRSAPGGKIGKALKPLVDRYTWEVIRPAWQRYLTEKDAEFASPADFAQKVSLWLNKHVGRSTNIEASKATILGWLKRKEAEGGT